MKRYFYVPKQVIKRKELCNYFNYYFNYAVNFTHKRYKTRIRDTLSNEAIIHY